MLACIGFLGSKWNAGRFFQRKSGLVSYHGLSHSAWLESRLIGSGCFDVLMQSSDTLSEGVAV